VELLPLPDLRLRKDRCLLRDEQMLLNLSEIATWLDSLIVEVNRINEVVEDLIAEAPVSVEAWNKVGDQIWSK